jgi:hypothetical protein
VSILRHKTPRPTLRRGDRALLLSLTRFWDPWRSAIIPVNPETVLRSDCQALLLPSISRLGSNVPLTRDSVSATRT